MTISRMPQNRRKLDPAKINERFGLHFQSLVVGSGLTVAEIRQQLAMRRQHVSESGLRKWMRGDTCPSLFAIEALGEIFALPDYRHILPPPFRPRRK
jgi:hypothetical protein